MIFITGEMGGLGNVLLLAKWTPEQVHLQQANDEGLGFYVSNGLLEVQSYLVTV